MSFPSPLQIEMPDDILSAFTPYEPTHENARNLLSVIRSTKPKGLQLHLVEGKRTRFLIADYRYIPQSEERILWVMDEKSLGRSLNRHTLHGLNGTSEDTKKQIPQYRGFYFSSEKEKWVSYFESETERELDEELRHGLFSFSFKEVRFYKCRVLSGLVLPNGDYGILHTTLTPTKAVEFMFYQSPITEEYMFLSRPSDSRTLRLKVIACGRNRDMVLRKARAFLHRKKFERSLIYQFSESFLDRRVFPKGWEKAKIDRIPRRILLVPFKPFVVVGRWLGDADPEVVQFIIKALLLIGFTVGSVFMMYFMVHLLTQTAGNLSSVSHGSNFTNASS